MKRKIIYAIIGVVVVALTFAGIKTYQMYQLYGLGIIHLDGNGEIIPESIKTPPPLTRGDSDWPTWRGPTLDGKSPLTGIQKDWSSGLPMLWDVTYLCEGEDAVSWSGPAIQGNRVVVTGRNETQDMVFCLHAESGQLIWHNTYETVSIANFGAGPRATPTIENEFVYTLGRSGDLVCWTLFDGTLVWKKNLVDEGGKLPEWGFSSSPFILDHIIVVKGGGEAGMIAFDKVSGETAWKSSTIEAGYATAITIELDSITALLNFHGTGLSCVNATDGTLLWELPWETDYFVNATTPVVKDDTVFFTSAYKMGGQAIKVSETGYTVLWKNDVIASQFSDQVLIDGYLYGYTANGNNSGPFKCVKLSTGEEMWSTKKIGGGSAIYVDNHLLCLDVKGNLYLVEPNPHSIVIAGEFKKAISDVSQQAWTSPAVANGRLYLRYMHRLICYDLMP